MLKSVDRLLQIVGGILGDFALGVIGCGFALSLGAGMLAFMAIGNYAFGIIALFVVWSLTALFLAVYVWEPHMRKEILQGGFSPP